MPDATKLAYLRKLRATGPSTDSERAELDHAGNVYGDRWWLKQRDREWFALAEAVAQFHASTGRWPRSDRAEAEEQRLGKWLSQQRTAANSGSARLTAERRSFLEEVAPGWNPDREQLWRGFAEQVGQFFATHHRWPSTVADDAEERRLGQWLNQERVRANTANPLLTDERRAHLDATAPGWRDGREANWQRALHDVSAFRHEHDRWPSATATTKQERRLAYWILDQRKDARNSAARFTTGRRTSLDAVAPGWDISRA